MENGWGIRYTIESVNKHNSTVLEAGRFSVIFSGVRNNKPSLRAIFKPLHNPTFFDGQGFTLYTAWQGLAYLQATTVRYFPDEFELLFSKQERRFDMLMVADHRLLPITIASGCCCCSANSETLLPDVAVVVVVVWRPATNCTNLSS